MSHSQESQPLIHDREKVDLSSRLAFEKVPNAPEPELALAPELELALESHLDPTSSRHTVRGPSYSSSFLAPPPDVLAHGSKTHPGAFWMRTSELVYFTLHCVIKLVCVSIHTNLITQCKVK